MSNYWDVLSWKSPQLMYMSGLLPLTIRAEQIDALSRVGRVCFYARYSCR